MKKGILTYILFLLAGIALSRFDVVGYYHELIHYFAAWIEGVDAQIVGWSRIRVAYATPFIAYSAYVGEFITYTVAFFYSLKRGWLSLAALFFGLFIDIIVSAPMGTDFNEVAVSALQSEEEASTIIVIWSVAGLLTIATMLGAFTHAELERRKYVRQCSRQTKEYIPRKEKAQPTGGVALHQRRS